MPQLNPFFFTNEVIFVFVYIICMLYILSRYLLPESFRNIITRNLS